MRRDGQDLRRADRLRELTQTLRGTDMGKLLRRFWHPIAVAKKLAKGTARPVRILGEDLTLYRGASGKPYLVGGRCAHRLTLLHTGWVEGEHIRCMYHGWKYEGTGQCVERPAEADPGLPNVSIAGYPLHEYCGLVFAYLGEEPAPAFDLPRKDAFERAGWMTFAREETWNCNWFQTVENSLDAVHVSFVHQTGGVASFGKAVTAAVPTLEYLETEAGIKQSATRSKDNVRVSDWTFPNNNHINLPGFTEDSPWIHDSVWMVPADDEHTTKFIAFAVPSLSAEEDRKVVQYFEQSERYLAADHHDELFGQHKYPEAGLVELTMAQDYVSQVGQGVVADRANEWLGKSDAGIVLLRKIFWRELSAMCVGGAPKQWRRLEQPTELPVPAAEAVSA
jgi:5,5'-dehydrodivanillate O-demethylase